jgi:hypothetical protein
MTDEDVAEIARHIEVAKAGIRQRTAAGREPPDLDGPTPPHLVDATPSLFG